MTRAWECLKLHSLLAIDALIRQPEPDYTLPGVSELRARLQGDRKSMPAYFFCTMTIHDPETFRKYTALTPAIVARYGGRYLTRGDLVTTPEGEPFEERMVLLEFPDRTTAEAWYNDPAYQDASRFRRASSKGRMFLQEGRTDTAAPDPKV